MAFRSNGPITVSLPPFRGVTRRIILVAVVVFFALLVVGLFARDGAGLIASLCAFGPLTAYKLLWQLITYPFINEAIFSLLFAGISIWFFGSTLEDELGSRWMAEFFVATTVGGALIAILVVLSLGGVLPISGLYTCPASAAVRRLLSQSATRRALPLASVHITGDVD